MIPKSHRLEYDSIIFDLDGTLWKTVSVVSTVWKSLLDSVGVHLSADAVQKRLFRSMGTPLDVMCDIVLEGVPQEKRDTLMRKGLQKEDDALRSTTVPLCPGVAEYLPQLFQSFTLCIVSNCQDGYIENFLQIHGLTPYIRDWESHGRTGLSKAENIQHVVQRNNLQVPVYVGDTNGDREAAHSAGIPFIFVSYGFGILPKGVKSVVAHSFQELAEMLQKR